MRNLTIDPDQCYCRCGAMCEQSSAGDLSLSHAMPAQDLDHDTEVTVAAGIQHVRARADTLDNFAHVRDTYSHGALPAPLAARPMSRGISGKSITL
jgi:hypothetical protein